MNELNNPGASDLQPEKTLILKILNESDQILKTVNIKTSLSVDEVIRAIDLNLYKSTLDQDALRMIQEKIDPLIKLEKDSLDLIPVLAEAMRGLKEAQIEIQENHNFILESKKQYQELRNWVLSDQSKEVPNIESEG